MGLIVLRIVLEGLYLFMVDLISRKRKILNLAKAVIRTTHAHMTHRVTFEFKHNQLGNVLNNKHITLGNILHIHDIKYRTTRSGLK